MRFAHVIHYGPVCAGACPHESCWVIACPALFVTPVPDLPHTRSVK